MKIVKLWGGLGNQMFQYAFGLSLSEHGETVKYDRKWLDDNKEYLGENYIDQVFDIVLDTASEKETAQMISGKRDLFHRVGRKLGIIEKTYYYEDEAVRGTVQKEVLTDSRNKYLQGYWQAEGYFSAYREKVMKAFTARHAVNEGSRLFLSRIMNDSSSVSVHIRLGDYEKQVNSVTFGGICTEEYYEKAFSCIEKSVKNPQYYLFSNEPAKALKMMGNRPCCIIDCNNEQNGWNDMYLMSKCMHNIIANSSFSWWGAYLNKNQKKVVVMPYNWTNNHPRNGLRVDGWTYIE